MKKKSDAIACHCVQEAVAIKEILIAHEPPDTNLSDLMMKEAAAARRRATREIGQGGAA
jgi:hypothetical protein